MRPVGDQVGSLVEANCQVTIIAENLVFSESILNDMAIVIGGRNDWITHANFQCRIRVARLDDEIGVIRIFLVNGAK